MFSEKIKYMFFVCLCMCVFAVRPLGLFRVQKLKFSEKCLSCCPQKVFFNFSKHLPKNYSLAKHVLTPLFTPFNVKKTKTAQNF